MQTVDFLAEPLAVAHGERRQADDGALPRRDDEIGGEIGWARGAPHQQCGVPSAGRNRDEHDRLVGARQIGRQQRAVLARHPGGEHENAAAHRLGEGRQGGPLAVLRRRGIAGDAAQDVALVEQDDGVLERKDGARGGEQGREGGDVAGDVQQGIEQGEMAGGRRRGRAIGPVPLGVCAVV
ncbi:MAG TPA: hypothetical protein VFF43_10390 [Caldimonas sp.]|nr:hypothetical protein [Caldimonas sp.]